MSVLERRLQLLLDQRRYDRLEAEARSSGRSVAAVIRQAIDAYFENDAARRAAAAQRFLAWSPDDGVEPDWAETKRAIEERSGIEHHA